MPRASELDVTKVAAGCSLSPRLCLLLLLLLLPLLLRLLLLLLLLVLLRGMPTACGLDVTVVAAASAVLLLMLLSRGAPSA